MLRIVLGFVLAVALVPVTAGAQGASGNDTGLTLQRQQRRIIVSPRPSPETAVQDTEQVAGDVEREARQERIIREGVPPSPSRRPDLDRDVAGGIQGRSLNQLRR